MSREGREAYLDLWSRLHGGYDPRTSFWSWRWLTLAYWSARPFVAARVAPDLVTLLGVLVSAGATGLAALQGRWVVAAAAVVVLSALLDSLDGAVALLTGRTSAWGSVLDSVVDRVSDGLYLVALWLVGAPPGLCVAAGALTVLQEYARARAAASGMQDIGVVTVWERPTRVVVTSLFLLGAGLYVGAAATWAALGAAAWVGLGVVGLVQLLVVVRRRLR
ncbi:CDP-alcohol phosphatidyltransferase family protein [Vallicoccus soli]|uniref:CDP-alcohol phosphatidyltransferase family protein n=1 Tax=Vallicoccus soli TaxID=2339232 RepID=A0A3A3Z551_9ACTN|nr:CDP-alcohol phosphatidyltransferase family protein [Vallicoccus soli]